MTRAAMIALGLGLAACGGGGSAAPDMNGLDVLVSSQRVSVYVGFVAIDGFGGVHFPQPGACGSLESDANILVQTCLTELSIGGVALASESPYPDEPANPFSGGGVAAATTLRVVDCGHTVELPVRGGPYVAATDVHATRVGSAVTVQWSAPGAASVIASVGGGFGTTDCNTVGESEHSFAGYGDASFLGVSATALDAPDVIDTELGPVRIWYGDEVVGDVTN